MAEIDGERRSGAAMSFRIQWYVAEREWEELRREQDNPDYDNAVLARVDLLDGAFQMLADDEPLFPAYLIESRPGRVVSIIDLAYQLAGILTRLNEHTVPVGSYALFSAIDTYLEIVFARTDHGIEITASGCSGRPGCRILTSEVDFRSGVEAFLHSFAVGVNRWAPHALRWPALAGLRRYLN